MNHSIWSASATMRSFWRSMPLMLLAVVAGCHHDCLTTPCPSPGAAAVITLVSAATGAPVSGGTVRVNGSSNIMSCNDGSCSVSGGAGKYVLDISAPGFTGVQQTLTVTSTTHSGDVSGPGGYEGKSCGCDVVNTQNLTVRLTPVS